MTNIIKFPQKNTQPKDSDPATVKPAKNCDSKKKSVLDRSLHFVWVVVVLIWPILKWMLSLDVFFQMLRMVYHWNTPGIYAGWTFLLHFSALTALTYFVSFFRPKGAR
ncbi:MAG: protein kleE [Methylobacter sp.]|uniref:KleE stable inheritance protein n=1 Tax=Methylobacter sp. TaxID=2051955 RepID=UPI00258409E5|nr:KleE stable inheritance protein [Methylobacter sp.]MCL7423227.1 protein kleE [Methylobacter sp.]